MEEKKLNFNQPLLSVRRSSSTLPSESKNKTKPEASLPKLPPLPVYKSELKSGPVRNAGTVPFKWERTPGRPKNETKSGKQSLQKPPIAPKLPPGRTLSIQQQALSRNCETNGTLLSNSLSVHSLDKDVMKRKSPKAIVEDARSSGSEYNDGDDDDSYVDAADTLSRSESFFLNCSVSGVSGLDGPDLQPIGIFSSDPQTRDFMMGRFLPAAKAMASETSPHSTRNQLVVQEQPKPIKKAVPKEKQCRDQQNPNNFPYLQYWQAKKSEESENEDENDRPESTVHGVCGLVPQFCLKGSFGLLNPVPGVRLQAQKAVSVRRLRSKYPLSGSYNEIEHEQARGARYEQGPRGYGTTEMHEDMIKSKREQNQNACGNQKVNGSAQGGALQGNELSTSVVRERNKEVDNFGISCSSSHAKGDKIFRERLAIEGNRRVSGSTSPMAEKTLYIDTLHKVKSSDTNSSTSDTKRLTDCTGDPSDDSKKFADIEANLLIDASVKNEKAGLRPPSPKPVDSGSRSYPGRSISGTIQDCSGPRSQEMAENNRVHLESEVPKKPCIQKHPHEPNQAIIALARSEVADNIQEKIGLEIELFKRSSTSESYNGNHSQRPVAPPLPKAPSDSWLKRTLPTVSAKNSLARSSLRTHNHSKVEALKNTSEDPRWETMVKTSNRQHGHLRFSAEKLVPIPEA